MWVRRPSLRGRRAGRPRGRRGSRGGGRGLCSQGRQTMCFAKLGSMTSASLRGRFCAGAWAGSTPCSHGRRVGEVIVRPPIWKPPVLERVMSMLGAVARIDCADRVRARKARSMIVDCGRWYLRSGERREGILGGRDPHRRFWVLYPYILYMLSVTLR